MYKINVVFFVDVGQRADVRDRIHGQSPLRPLDSLLGKGVEPQARLMLDSHTVVIPYQANIHIHFGQFNTFVRVGSIPNQIAQANRSFDVVVLHGLQHSLECGKVGMDVRTYSVKHARNVEK
jgi:hypothetical protein